MGNPNPLDPCTRSFMSCDNPCHDPSNPCKGKLPDQIDTFITQFFGPVGKSAVNGEVVWSLPCGLDVGTVNNPILPGESLACYFLRLFEAGVPGQIGLPGSPGQPGLPGADAFSYTQQDFDQPSLSAPYINILLTPSSSLIPGLFYQIDTSGFYQLQNINPDGSSLFTLVQPQAGAPAVIPAGVSVVASGMPGIRVQGPTGPQGVTGARGPQKINSTVTTAPFNKPALLGFVSITAAYNPLSEVFSTVYVKITGDGSYYKVLNSDTSGDMTLQLVSDAGGPTVQPAGSAIVMCGSQGIQGPPGTSVQLVSGQNGFSPFVAGSPSPTTVFPLTNAYAAVGVGPYPPANIPAFTTPLSSYTAAAPNYNGTFFAVFRAFGSGFNGGGGSANGTIWFKIVDSISGDVPGSERIGIFLTGASVNSVWQTIPVLVTNNTGIARTWGLYAKSNISGGSLSASATLGLCGVSWFKML